MEASPRKHGMYYRCPARTLAPGSPVLETHPPAVYLREDLIRDAVNGWLAKVFARENVDATVAALVASQHGRGEPDGRERAKKRLTDAEARLRRFQDAIAAGVDPAALVDSINQAQAERAAAQAEVRNAPAPNVISDAEVYARIDSLPDDVGAAVSSARPDRLATLYMVVDLQVRYVPAEHVADVSIRPLGRVNSACVRGASCTLTTRLRLPDLSW